MRSAPAKLTPRARGSPPSRNCGRSPPTNSRPGRGLGMSWPIIDGWVIPDDQYKLYAAGKYNDTPILVGYNSDEGASFSPPKTPEDYIAGVKARYGPFAERPAESLSHRHQHGSQNRARLERATPRSAGTPGLGRGCRRRPENPRFSTITSTSIPNIRKARPGPVMGHRTAWRWPTCSSISIPTNSAAHKDGLWRSRTPWPLIGRTSPSSGDPNGDGVPIWPAFSDAHPVVMYFGQTPHTGPVPSVEALKSLDAYFAWRRTPEGEAFVE